jgi:hypothetical protein
MHSCGVYKPDPGETQSFRSICDLGLGSPLRVSGRTRRDNRANFVIAWETNVVELIKGDRDPARSISETGIPCYFRLFRLFRLLTGICIRRRDKLRINPLPLFTLGTMKEESWR